MASPATEARLLAVACGATAAQVERLVRGWRQADQAAQADGEQVRLAGRMLNTQVDQDGMVLLRARLTPEVGAVLLRAVEAALEQVPSPAAAAPGDEPTLAQRRADALGLVAESALAGGLDPGNPGDRFQVTVHVQTDTVASREPAITPPHVAAETCAARAEAPATVRRGQRTSTPVRRVIEQAGGLHVGREAARRVACDAPPWWRCATATARSSMSVAGRARCRRPLAVPCSTAIAAKCQFPGCTSRRCDAHHVVHWADRGETQLSNLVL